MEMKRQEGKSLKKPIEIINAIKEKGEDSFNNFYDLYRCIKTKESVGVFKLKLIGKTFDISSTKLDVRMILVDYTRKILMNLIDEEFDEDIILHGEIYHDKMVIY